jgi:hypothetical protein
MAPAAEERERLNAAQLLFLSCLHSEKEVGMQVSLVMMSCLSRELLLHLLVYH